MSATPSSFQKSCAHGVAVVAAFFLLLLLLNAEAMERSAEMMEFGETRDAAMRMVKPFASVARFSRCTCIRHAAERLESTYLE